jgi:hypothetical protein
MHPHWRAVSTSPTSRRSPETEGAGRGNILARLPVRDRIVRAAFHALWLRGLRAPAPWRYGVGIVAAVLAALVRTALNRFERRMQPRRDVRGRGAHERRMASAPVHQVLERQGLVKLAGRNWPHGGPGCAHAGATTGNGDPARALTHEVAQTIRSQVKWTALIALTGYGEGADRHRAEAAGFTSRVLKPVDPLTRPEIIASSGSRKRSAP